MYTFGNTALVFYRPKVMCFHSLSPMHMNLSKFRLRDVFQNCGEKIPKLMFSLPSFPLVSLWVDDLSSYLLSRKKMFLHIFNQ